MALSFVIASAADLLYECRLSAGASREDQQHVHQFVLNSALDMVEEKKWLSTAMHLKVVDEFNDLQVHAWVAANGARMLLLHQAAADDVGRRARVEDSVRSFFEEVNELYVKVALNPFNEKDQAIDSPVFDKRVRAIAAKCGL